MGFFIFIFSFSVCARISGDLYNFFFLISKICSLIMYISDRSPRIANQRKKGRTNDFVKREKEVRDEEKREKKKKAREYERDDLLKS